ncbi:hypothetical protein SISSUDRAFT_1067800 [Sistotremastrum suecicum HHB10207 ss-3]|uniref:Uncharacterized protein n=1 Tax=Sistotremastrum suecicum HHB10207 ss-3 TaxID=1314776 RepID=A0A165WP90_9AGAM|nr:hypothetical protein SISSUDRAFT_1067800 [Sistotremastrum suecicum HHB10207 ss-3]
MEICRVLAQSGISVHFTFVRVIASFLLVPAYTVNNLPFHPSSNHHHPRSPRHSLPPPFSSSVARVHQRPNITISLEDLHNEIQSLKDRTGAFLR